MGPLHRDQPDRDPGPAKVVAEHTRRDRCAGNWTLTATPTGTFPAGPPAQTVTGIDRRRELQRPPGCHVRAHRGRGPPGYTSTRSTVTSCPGEPARRHTSPSARSTPAICTFTNDDTPATLTLVKTVTNDNGGTAVADRLDAGRRRTDPDHRRHRLGRGHQRCRQRRHLHAVRDRRPGRLHRRRLVCTGGTVTGSSVVVANGANATCTINNNDIRRAPDPGQDRHQRQRRHRLRPHWTLTAAGPDPDQRRHRRDRGHQRRRQRRHLHPVRVRRPGRLHRRRLVLHRRHPHRRQRSSCPLGTSATCTINNNDQPAHLTLVKTVTNDNGGTAVADRLDPRRDRTDHRSPAPPARPRSPTRRSTPAPTPCPSPAARPATPPGAWSCTAGTLTGASLVLPHRRQRHLHHQQQRPARHLTLVKTVTNDNGGTAVRPRGP